MLAAERERAMIYAFAFALVLGGILLGASILVGDGHGDLGGHGGDFHITGDSVDAVVGTLRSLRFWTFFLAFFGLTGVALKSLHIVDSDVLSALIAAGMGLTVGYGATWAFRVLDRRESNSMAAEDDLVGKSGRVLVAVSPGTLGKLRVTAKGSTVDLLAKSDDETFAVNDDATVIEMDGTIARIARVDGGADAASRLGGE